jgi:4-hydroxy-tetrahydrodipicolinate synthase
MTTFHLSLQGIVPPLVTPLKARDELDGDGLACLLDYVIEGGVAGVFILGTTGEAPSLSYRLRREVIGETTRLVNGRVPVLVGVTDTAFVESVDLAKHAADCGADAAVLTTPYYFPAGQTELTAYVQNIAPLIPLPLMLYNMPGLTKVWFEIETLRKLSSIESIVGVKDSSGDLDYFGQLCKLKAERSDWTVLIGPEAKLVEAHELGGDGGVSGGANVAPRLFVDCHRALCDGDQKTVAETCETILAFQEIYEIGKYASRYIKATKSALSLLGICSDLPADPFHPFLAPERERVATILRGIGLMS